MLSRAAAAGGVGASASCDLARAGVSRQTCPQAVWARRRRFRQWSRRCPVAAHDCWLPSRRTPADVRIVSTSAGGYVCRASRRRARPRCRPWPPRPRRLDWRGPRHPAWLGRSRGPLRPAPLPRLDRRGPRHPAWLGRSRGPRRPAPLPRLDRRGPRHPAWLGRSTAPHGSCVDTMLRAAAAGGVGASAQLRPRARGRQSANVPAGGVGAAAPLSTMVEALPGCRT